VDLVFLHSDNTEADFIDGFMDLITSLSLKIEIPIKQPKKPVPGTPAKDPIPIMVYLASHYLETRHKFWGPFRNSDDDDSFDCKVSVPVVSGSVFMSDFTAMVIRNEFNFGKYELEARDHFKVRSEAQRELDCMTGVYVLPLSLESDGPLSEVSQLFLSAGFFVKGIHQQRESKQFRVDLFSCLLPDHIQGLVDPGKKLVRNIVLRKN
jgi:hypothetical protein